MKKTAFKPRSKPMRRTRFESTKPGQLVTLPAHEPREPRRAGPEFRYGQPQVAALFQAPKRDYVRSKALMKAYRLIPCQHCGANDGTVCGAHSNWAIHGKGMSEKADDNRCASLCFLCHSMLDQGSKLLEDERKALWWRAHVSTLVLLAKHRLWPRDVLFPDIETNPFF